MDGFGGLMAFARRRAERGLIAMQLIVLGQAKIFRPGILESNSRGEGCRGKT